VSAGSDEPTDAEFSIDEDEPVSRYSKLTGESRDSAAEGGGDAEPAETGGPREIDLGDVDDAPRPIETKDDDELLRIIGRSDNDDDERKQP
jgi:hypothetical protein